MLISRSQSARILNNLGLDCVAHVSQQHIVPSQKRRSVCLNELAPCCWGQQSFLDMLIQTHAAVWLKQTKKWRKHCRFCHNHLHSTSFHSWHQKEKKLLKNPLLFGAIWQMPTEYDTLRGTKASSSQMWKVSKIWHVLDSALVQIMAGKSSCTSIIELTQ